MKHFKVFNKLKEVIDTYRDRLSKEGEPPMDDDKKVRWFEKQRVWWSAFVLVLITLLTCTFFLHVDIEFDLKGEIKIERPWDKPKILGNK